MDSTGMTQLVYWSARDLASAIRQRTVSVEEVVEVHLQRIEEVNGRLNAVVQLNTDNARAAAQRADAMLARNEPVGHLHGVPMTIKDSFDTVGIVSTWGTPGRAKFVPGRDATVVQRLKDAGAILLGKTNTPEFTLYFETVNSIYGRTSNPYNLDRTSGGSSGGAAAIVASGGAAFDIGTDTGGSVRLPSHFCGIAGLKPTSGRVPRTGHAVPAGGLVDALTQPGPMARYVDDLALLLPIIAGPDHRDPFVAPVSLHDPADVDLNGLRCAFHVDNGIRTPQPDIVEAVHAAVTALAEAGVQVEEKRPPGIGETAELMPQLLRGWDGGAAVRRLLAQAGTQEADSSLQNFLSAPSGSGESVVELFGRWDQFRMRMLDFFRAYDIIVCPTNARTAIEHGTLAEYYPAFSYTMTYNLTGWPGAVVRTAADAEALPIGVQVVARPWREDVALAVAAYLEGKFGGWQRPPM